MGPQCYLHCRGADLYNLEDYIIPKVEIYSFLLARYPIALRVMALEHVVAHCHSYPYLHLLVKYFIQILDNVS